MTQSGHFVSGQELDSRHYPKPLLQHLVDIGSAIDIETKMDEGYEVKKKPQSLPSSQPDKASPKKMRNMRTKKAP